jgi:hypothetical protein
MIENRIRLRAIILGLVFGLAICVITPFNNAYSRGTPLGGGHFPLAPFFVLVWLLALSAIVGKRLGNQNLLSGKELLVIWIQMVVASGIAYTGLVRTFFINLTVPFHFATMENRWRDVLLPLLPKVWYPQSEKAVEELYNGLSGGAKMTWLQVLLNIPWASWLKPLIVWGIFILLCYFIMICLINIFGKQMIENERMDFPMLRVPEMMAEALETSGIRPFVTHRFLLCGLLVPVVLHFMNGLHFYFPVVPQIPTLNLLGPYYPRSGLFLGFSQLRILIYPAFTGFAFFTARQISFSCWVFFILGILFIGLLSLVGYQIPAAALGVTFGPSLYRPDQTQMIGAYGVFFLFLLWLARHHLIAVFRRAFILGKKTETGAEWFSTTYSFWGLVSGFFAIIFWCHYYGMPLAASFLFIFVCFMIMLVATRIICQGGIAYFTLTAAPIDGLLFIFGAGFFSNTGILVAGVVQKVLFLDLRESLMPSLLHARKITRSVANMKTVFVGLAVTLVSGLAVSFCAMLALCYKFGLRDLKLDWAMRTTVAVYDNIYTLIESPVQSSHWTLVFSILGCLVMLTLIICYHRLYWWPLHPIGYLTAYSSAMGVLWFSFLMGWLCNALCHRYGGAVWYKKLGYFFAGLIIGDFLMGGIWAIVGLFTGSSYMVLPR